MDPRKDLVVKLIHRFASRDQDHGISSAFPSGAKLVAVEYNPPCIEVGEKLAAKYCTRSGRALAPRDFPVAAIGLRGLVGVVDVPGVISVGDEVRLELWGEERQFNLPRPSTHDG